MPAAPAELDPAHPVRQAAAPGDAVQADAQDRPAESEPAADEDTPWSSWWLPGIAAVGLAAGWTGQGLGVTALAWAGLIVCYLSAGWVALEAAWETLRQLKLDVDVIMLLAAGIAAAMGQPAEGGLLLVLFAAARAMEEFSQRRANSALHGLQSLWPQQALLITAEGPQMVGLHRVQAGDRVLIRPGDRVPVDGVVLSGASAMDESALTGESVPKEVATGDRVHAGTLNIVGRLTVKCTVPARESTLARIIALVGQALKDRPSAQRLLDTLGPYIAWIVLAGSGLVMLVGGFFNLWGGWMEAVYRGLTLMIVGSPCALIISTPVAYLAGLSAAARMGVLVKGGRYLEALAGVKVVVFDKTGTLTTGQIRVLSIEKRQASGAMEPACTACAARALSLAAGLEVASSHPLGKALVAEAATRKIEPTHFAAVTETAGHGLVGTPVCGPEVRIGRRTFAERADGAPTNGHPAAADGDAGVWLAAGHELYRFTFADTMRPEAADVVRRLRAVGIRHTEMLTGDSRPAAEAITRQVGLDDFRCNLLPEDKITRTEELARTLGPVAMVGDGVNDAAALAKVRCGIAVGRSESGGGSDITIDAAPVVLLGGNLAALPRLFAHAHRTRLIVAQNLALACAVIVIMAVNTLIIHVPLPLAVLAHEGSTVLVALNALRLLRG